jgi:intraflagellar transport protein 74
MEQTIQNISRAVEERLNELHPDQRREYEDLSEENEQLTQDLSESRNELDLVNGRLNAAEGRLRSDLLRTRSQQLQDIRKELSERMESLHTEVRQCSMPVAEQREALLGKVKEDNKTLVELEKSNGTLKLACERLRSQIQEVVSDSKEKKDENSDQQKYEVLFTKDQEMTQFIDSFDETKAEEEKKLKQKQDSIVRLLENITKALHLPSDVSPEAHMNEMEDELDFKNKQLQNSESTQSRLEGELAKREGELEKIESLDVKISQELQQVEDKMKQYQNEIQHTLSRLCTCQLCGTSFI